MIKTNDNRKFFTEEENYEKLIEFSKIFDAEISIVKVKEPKILNMTELAPAICNINYNNKQEDYEIIKIKSSKKKTRKEILEQSLEIKEYIKNKLLNNQEISLKEIFNNFKEYNLTKACLCNHFKQIRDDLLKSNYTLIKTGWGKYKIL